MQPEIVATAASWAIYGAAKAWFQTPNRPPVKEIVPVILGWVVPILQTRSIASPMHLTQKPRLVGGTP
jgi:hypothetical protein